jgi:uncharacterized membrane protein YgdD (TMEM256/DUF423 family)
MSSSLLWKTGAIFGATAVGLGAFGAHGLKKHINEPHKLANWGTAAQYQVNRPPSFLSHNNECSRHDSSSTPSPSSSPVTILSLALSSRRA